jgi:hypothetical protein
VFEPDVIVAPEGTLHVYPVAPDTAKIEYVCPLAFAHKVLVPVINPGVVGAPSNTVTDKDVATLVPQALEAVTVISPLSPYAPVVTVISVVF